MPRTTPVNGVRRYVTVHGPRPIQNGRITLVTATQSHGIDNQETAGENSSKTVSVGKKS